MALLSDSSWYWSFVAAGAQQGPRSVETFWHSAIRWLVRDPALTPMRVTAERRRFEPSGDAPRARRAVRGAITAPPRSADRRRDLGQRSDAARGPPSAGPTATPVGARAAAAPGVEGDGHGEARDGTPIGKPRTRSASRRSRELIEAAPRPRSCAPIASATKGQGAGPRPTPDDAAGAIRARRGRPRPSKPLSDNWKVLVLLCAVVGAESTLRRRGATPRRVGARSSDSPASFEWQTSRCVYFFSTRTRSPRRGLRRLPRHAP